MNLNNYTGNDKLDYYIDLYRANLTKPYEEYEWIIHDYIKFLKRKIKGTPNDLRLYNQLAIMKLESRASSDISRRILKGALKKIEGHSDSKLVAMTLSNLAYFYLEELSYKKPITKKAIKLLEQSITLFEFPQAFYMLAYSYFILEDYKIAVVYAEKAAGILASRKNKFCYAACAFAAGDTGKAIEIYKDFLDGQCISEELENEFYYYALALAENGDTAATEDIAEKFLHRECEEDINFCDIGLLHFKCGNFRKAKEAFDLIKYTIGNDYLAEYYYCCMILGDENAMLNKYNAKLDQDKADLEEALNDDSDDLTEQEKHEHIENCKKYFEETKHCFQQAKEQNSIPHLDIKPYLALYCELIECPRHWFDH